MSKPTVDDLKRWALRKFRERLRGRRLSEQFERWVSGEMGRDYTFQIEMTLDDDTARFFNDPANREKLRAEHLADEVGGAQR